jgi:glycosyltransferase involved in cell wall biosynthesis
MLHLLLLLLGLTTLLSARTVALDPAAASLAPELSRLGYELVAQQQEADLAIVCSLDCPVSGRQRYLWPQEASPKGVSAEGLAGLFWLSEWQRDQWIAACPAIAQLPSAIVGHGIDPKQFGRVKERINPYSCVYVGSYARGLQPLLDYWPVIKVLFPKATLDLCGGWTPDVSAKLRAELTDSIRQLEAYGVRECVALSQSDIDATLSAASFWIYPCTYDEPFCPVALRAQMAGAVPLVIHRAALKETVRHGYVAPDMSNFLPMIIVALEEVEAIPHSQRENQRKFILERYTWPHIAQRMHQLF